MRNRNVQAGIALGALFGIMHTFWIIAVGLDLGQPILTILESGHFISPIYSTTDLHLVTAFLGFIGAIFTGYIIGWTFMYIYNFTGKRLD